MKETEKRETSFVVRFLVFVLGLLIMTLGIAISVKSNLGVSPVSSIPYTITCVWGIEMGKATILFHIALILLQILLLRKAFRLKNLLQLPVGIMFGYFTTFCNYLMTFLPDPGNIYIQLTMMLISSFLLALGIFFYVPMDMVPLAGEGAMLAISKVTGKPFSTIKICFDTSMVTISLITCVVLIHALGSVGLGTVCAAFLVGMMLKFITKKFGATRDKYLRVPSMMKAEDASSAASDSPLTDIMKKDVYTIDGNEDLTAVLKLLIEKKISGVPVVDRNQTLIGFISDGDILRYLATEHPLYVNPSDLITMDFDAKLRELMHCKVQDIAGKQVITVDVQDDLGTICRVLTQNHIKKAPVMKDGAMVGIINVSNVTKYAFRRLENI